MRGQLALMLTLALGCGNAREPASSGMALSGTRGGGPRANADSAIRTLENRWRHVVAARDTAAIRKFYTEDAYTSLAETP